MRAFVEWLRAEGYYVTEFSHGWTLQEKDSPYDTFTFRNTTEEQPEVLVWCLKELEQRTLEWALTKEPGDYLCQALLFDQYALTGRGPTMTQAAINALVSTSGVREE